MPERPEVETMYGAHWVRYEDYADQEARAGQAERLQRIAERQRQASKEVAERLREERDALETLVQGPEANRDDYKQRWEEAGLGITHKRGVEGAYRAVANEINRIRKEKGERNG
jgi:uncharacterized membrane protein YccC